MQDIGDRLKSYEPLWENWYKDSYIGGGNFGRVYRLKQDFFGDIRYSAVKVIPIILDQELAMKKGNNQSLIDEKKALVIQEIKNMYKLSGKQYLVQCIAHNIKDIYDEKNNVVGFDVLIQMNYYMTLPYYMKENGGLSVKETEKLALQIGSALRSMHDINMLHRDVKVENIYIDDNGDFLLGDFGVSKQVESSNYSTMAGTPPFIAPEVWKVQQTNKRYVKTADIYSFGITLYYLLNDNMLPLVDENSTQNEIEAAVFDRLNGKAFPAPKNGSEKLKAIVMKCCEYEPDDRYQSMQEILNELETQEKPIVIHEENKPEYVEDEKSEATETDDIKETPIAETSEAFATVYADNDTEDEESDQEYETIYANEKETLDNADKKKDTKSHDSTQFQNKIKIIRLKNISTIVAVIIVLGAMVMIVNILETRENKDTNLKSDSLLTEINDSNSDSSLSESNAFIDDKTSIDEIQNFTKYPSKNSSYYDISIYGLSANHGILLNADSNEIISGLNYEDKIYPASLTKLMTLIVAVENIDNLDTEYTFTDDVLNYCLEKDLVVTGFESGETVTYEDLIYASVLSDGTDATLGLVKAIAGSEDEFVEMMNEKCNELGLNGTHFENANGLYSDNHYSTCQDIAVIMGYAINNNICRKVLVTPEYSTSKTIQHAEGIQLTSDFAIRFNGYFIEKGGDIIGGKTSKNDELNYSISSICEKDGVNYICVTVGSEGSYKAVEDNIAVYEKYMPMEKSNDQKLSSEISSDISEQNSETSGTLTGDTTIKIPLPNGIHGSYTIDIYRNGNIAYTQTINNAEAIADSTVNFDVSGKGTESLTVYIKNNESEDYIKYAKYIVDYTNETYELDGNLNEFDLLNTL